MYRIYFYKSVLLVSVPLASVDKVHRFYRQLDMTLAFAVGFDAPKHAANKRGKTRTANQFDERRQSEFNFNLTAKLTADLYVNARVKEQEQKCQLRMQCV